MKTKFFSVLIVSLFCILAVSCASTEAPAVEEPVVEAPVVEEVKAAVVVEIDGVKTGFDKLDEAIKSVAEGQTATVTVSQDLELKSLIEIKNKTITIVDAGSPITLKDAITVENYVEYNGKNVACCFHIVNDGKLILKGTETGGITFLGAGAEATITRRIMFYVGMGYKSMPEISGYLEFNSGITVKNISSTIFGGLVRGYGELVINGGVFTDNYVKGNGLFTTYYKTTINDCVVTNNDTANVGIFQLCNGQQNMTVVNGGTYENNTSAKRAAVFNTYENSTFILNGGTFKNNSVSEEGAGGAIYLVSKNSINGGTFENNVSCDIYVGAENVEGINKADIVVANVIVAPAQ